MTEEDARVALDPTVSEAERKAAVSRLAEDVGGTPEASVLETTLPIVAVDPETDDPVASATRIRDDEDARRPEASD